MASGVPSTVAIVEQLLTLAADPENQVFIVQEAGCINGLISYLAHADADVQRIAAKTMKHLTTHAKNKPVLKDNTQLVKNLRALTESPDYEAADDAQSCLDNLFPPVAPAPVTAAGTNENSASGVVVGGAGAGSGAREIEAGSGKGPQKMHTVILAIDGLFDTGMRFIVERALIRTKGVVSVTLDQIRGQAIVCTRTPDMEEALQGVLRAQGISARVFSTPKVRSVLSQAADDNGPMYLDDIYSMYTGKNNTVSTYGFSSLEARLEAKRREAAQAAKREERAQRFIGKVTEGLGSMLKFW